MIKKPGTEKVFNDSLSVWVKTNINKKLNSNINTLLVYLVLFNLNKLIQLLQIN